MLVSAEVRWFWRNAPPDGFEEWFRAATDSHCAAGGGEPRVDEYLLDRGQVELGLKRRGGKPGVEVKGLVSVIADGLAAGSFVGPIELWSKWTSERLDLNPVRTIATTKVRWARKFDTTGPSPLEIPLGADEKRLDRQPLPAAGCNVELTKVGVANETWWTFGFEAFGTLGTIENDLRAVAAIMVARQPPGIGNGILASYPAWLGQYLKDARPL